MNMMRPVIRFAVVSCVSLILSSLPARAGNDCRNALVHALDIKSHRVELAIENGRYPLEHVRIHIPPKFRHWEMSVELFDDYLHAMEVLKELRLEVLMSDGAEEIDLDVEKLRDLEERDRFVLKIIKERSDSVRSRVSLHLTEHDLEMWAQDSSKPLKSGAPLVPSTMDRHHLSETLARTIYREAHRVVSGFEGGNLVVGERHVFSLSTLMRANSHEHKELERFFGKTIFPVDLDSPELPHFDMNFHSDLLLAVAFSPRLQKEVIVLSSPQLAHEILQSTPSPSAEARLILYDINKYWTYFESWNSHNDHLKEALEKEGYQVVLIPGVTFPRVQRSTWGFMRNTALRAPMLHYNYVNAVFSENFVLMPWLDLPEFDESAAAVYESLGFSAIPMRSARPLLTRFGAVRCASYTARKDCSSPRNH